MMKYFITAICICILQSIQAQGLNAEIGFNALSIQRHADVLSGDGCSYHLRSEFDDVGRKTCLVSKVDTNGQVLWDTAIEPYQAEIIDARKMIFSETGGVYVTGYGREVCDVGGGCFWFLQKVAPDGSDEWGKIWEDSLCMQMQSSAIMQTEDSLIWVTTHYNGALRIQGSNPQGADASFVDFGSSNASLLTRTSSLAFILADQNSLINPVNSNAPAQVDFSTNIRDMNVWNDSLYVLTEDSCFLYSDTLTLIASVGIPLFSDFQSLELDAATVRFVSKQVGTVTIHTLDHLLQPVVDFTVGLTGNGNFDVGLDDEHISLARTFNLHSGSTVQFQDYSLLSSNSVDLNRTDIGITNLYVSNVTATPLMNSPGVYTMRVYGSVVLTNFGPDTLESCLINHYLGQGIACGHGYYKETFSNLSLLPGDSVELYLGQFYSETNYFGNGNPVVREFCPFTSYPNKLTDLNVSNDSYCVQMNLGVSSVEELEFGPKQLYKMYDLLGREVREPTPNQVIILQYSDGTTEKRVYGN